MKNFIHNLTICTLAILLVLIANYTLLVFANTMFGGWGLPHQWDALDRTLFQIIFIVSSIVSFILLFDNLDLKK